MHRPRSRTDLALKLRSVLLAALLAGCGNPANVAVDGNVAGGPPPGTSLEMPVARAAHAAVALADGRVLLIGGCVAESCEGGPDSATVDLFDPRSRRFARAGTLTMRRTSAAAVPLASGQVLIAGGWSGPQVTSAVELFDPAAGKARRVGDLSEARADIAAVRLRDGRVLLAGGYAAGKASATVEIFDPAPARLLRAGRLVMPRAGAAAVLLDDGRVLIAGGGTGGADGLVPTAAAEIFDPATGRSAPTGGLAAARYKHGSAKLPGGDVLVLGGSDARDAAGKLDSIERYDPGSGSFRPAGRMSEARYKIAGAVVLRSDGRVLIAGGGRRAELHDPAAASSVPIGPDFGARLNFASATALPDGSVLVAGGYDENGIRMSRRAWILPPPTR